MILREESLQHQLFHAPPSSDRPFSLFPSLDNHLIPPHSSGALQFNCYHLHLLVFGNLHDFKESIHANFPIQEFLHAHVPIEKRDIRFHRIVMAVPCSPSTEISSQVPSSSELESLTVTGR